MSAAVDKFKLEEFDAFAETNALAVVVAVGIAEEPEGFSLAFDFLEVKACFRSVSEAELAVCMASVLPCCDIIPLDRSSAEATRIGDRPSRSDEAPPFGSAEEDEGADDSRFSTSGFFARLAEAPSASSGDELELDASTPCDCLPPSLLDRTICGREDPDALAW